MRRFQKFFVELVLVGIFVGWLVAKNTERFNVFMPWILTVIVWHLGYKCFWQSEFVNHWREKHLTSSAKSLALIVVGNVALLLPVLCVARLVVGRLAGPPPTIAYFPASPAPSPSPSVPIIEQRAVNSETSNIVAGGDVNVNRDPQEKKHEKAKASKKS